MLKINNLFKTIVPFIVKYTCICKSLCCHSNISFDGIIKFDLTNKNNIYLLME